MNAFQRGNFKLDDPVKQGISCYEQDKNRQRFQSDKEPTIALERQNHLTIIKLQFLKWYVSVDVFSRSTENDPFVQFQSLTNDEILENNIRLQPGANVAPGTQLLQKKLISQA